MAGTTDYKNKWQKENLDRISLTVPKGQKEEIQAHATVQSESLNHFINRAVHETIARDRAHGALLEEAKALAEEIKKAGRDITIQDAIQLLEAFSVLKSVYPTVKQQYLSEISPKSGPRIVGLTPKLRT